MSAKPCKRKHPLRYRYRARDGGLHCRMCDTAKASAYYREKTRRFAAKEKA
jgi:hypothetical protein